MNVGDRLSGYELTQPFSNVGGGQSEWTFADKSGVSYFVKRFLRPTYPVDAAMGSQQTRERKRAQCARFEQHHQTVQRLLKPLSGPGGNLVVTRDFFRHGAHYFKATERVDKVDLPVNLLVALPADVVLGHLMEVAASLRLLHRKSLVHGDIKPDNILLTGSETRLAVHQAKLIDFDNCFVAGEPPLPEDMVGDPAFASPETIAYLVGDAEKPDLGQASDIFALALVFSHFLTGKLPTCKHRGYLGEGVLRGHAVEFPPLPASVAPIGALLTRMCCADPAARPDAGRVWTEVKELRRTLKGAPGDFGRVEAPTGVSRLRGSMVNRSQKKF
ncbi:MAG TPA: lipopolysaccharide kinase InaA family protein [Actinocrinis sp.]|nr:lipopolysaccharide kinase InaA family protein [Actinocrinis sp.]